MKYGDIINARRGYIKFNEGYQWAIMTLKAIKTDLREKNIKLDSHCPQHVINSLISKLCKASQGKECVKDIYMVSVAYLECDSCITNFEKTGNTTLIKEVEEKQNIFRNRISSYCKNAKKVIASSNDILREFINEIESYCNTMDNASSEIMRKAKEGLSEFKHTDILELDNSLSYNRSKLPRNICIGQYVAGDDKFSQMLFSDNEKMYALLNLTYKGSLYVRDLDNDPRSTDRFLTAYVFSILNKFPIGALNIHVIDKSPNLTKIIENKLNGNLNKKFFTVYKDFSILDKLNDTVCRDISKKIGSGCRNIYDLYEQDKSEALNLVIIKAAISQNSEYEITAALEKIKNLTRDYGHNCGIRFLIIDTGKDFKSSSNIQLSEIQKNCGIIAKKEKEKYSIAGLNFAPICFEGDEIEFIEKQSSKIVQLLSKRQKTSICYEDVVNTSERVAANDAVLRIPIGKSANKIVEMPFSCKNISGTAEAMCVSYMVIGATGSGKSSLFDSIVMSGCLKYSPEDLQFWLLDFKDGVSTEKYKRSNLSHIAVVADKNSPSDAIALFDMVLAEMQKRKDEFSRYSGCSDLYTYNQYAEKNHGSRLPRIIILIDEIQEIANCEYWVEIRDKLLAISNRIRAFGIHLVMIAQNLSDGKNNHLQDLLSQVNGRICFRIDNEETLRNSAMGESFTERYYEIKNLGQGEIYLKYGNMDEPIKLQLAYVAPTLFETKYFPSLHKKYQYPSRTRVVGELSQLTIDSYSTFLQMRYEDVFAKTKPSGKLELILGENSYTHELLSITLSEKENSGVCLVGSNKTISNSLMISTIASLIGKNITTYLFNGDSSNVIKDFANKIEDENIFYRARGELSDTISSLYSLFLERRKMEDDEIEATYEPIALCINDATGIRAVRENISMDECSDENSYEVKTISKVINELATEGYRYKIFVVISLTEDTFDEQLVANVSKMVLFHNSSFVPSSINSLIYSDLVQTISGGGEDSLALHLSNKTLTKFRPILYDKQRNEKTLDYIAKGSRNEKTAFKHHKHTYKS